MHIPNYNRKKDFFGKIIAHSNHTRRCNFKSGSANAYPNGFSSPNDYQKSIGQLAGFPDQTATHTSDGTSLDGSMLIFCDVKERHQNQILEKLCTMDVSITYKAILTPTNRHWTVFQLYDELHREHCAMTGKEQDDSK